MDVEQSSVWSKAGSKGQSEPVDLQHFLQQPRAFRLRLGYGCASVSILSLYSTSIKRLFTNTYKPPDRTVDPKVEGSSPFGLVAQSAGDTALTKASNKPDSARNQELVSGLFFEREIDADLKTIIDHWPDISSELRTAIVKMVS